MFSRKYAWLPAVCLALVVGGPAGAQTKSAKPCLAFGALPAPAVEDAKAQTAAWLKTAGKDDEQTRRSFDIIWAGDRPVVDRVAETFALAHDGAAKLLKEARTANAAPTDTPALLKETKRDAFFRANLTLAYAKALCDRRVYEEALDALRGIKAEDVVDPAAYLFHRAVAEYSLLRKEDATRTIVRLVEDATGAPERYKTVAVLMHLDMQSWRDKDLGWIARKMDNIERRLELARGGPQTQKMQKEVVARLDELIKDLENRKSGCCNCNGGGCPNGGNNPNNNIRASSPQNDSNGGNGSGPGVVDSKKLKELAEVWGKLPEKERAKAMQELQRDMPPRYREVIENYFKKLAQNDAVPPDR